MATPAVKGRGIMTKKNIANCEVYLFFRQNLPLDNRYIFQFAKNKFGLLPSCRSALRVGVLYKLQLQQFKASTPPDTIKS